MRPALQMATLPALVCLLWWTAAAEDGGSAEIAPIHLELGAYGNLVSHGLGTWRGAQGQLWIRSNPRFIPAFFFETQDRPTGNQQNYAFFSYLNWSSSFYTTQGISYAPQSGGRAIYFGKHRYDVNAFWKIPPRRQLVLSAGFTRIDFGRPGHGQIFNAGAIYYRKKLVIQTNVFANRSQPGNLWSGSAAVAAQYGREGAYWFGAGAGGGRELYRFIGEAATDLDFNSYSLNVFYRKWLSKHIGFVLRFDYHQKLTSYRWVGAGSNLFFEF